MRDLANKQHTSARTLLNAIELGSLIVSECAGNAISTKVAGKDVDDIVKATLAAKLGSHLSRYTTKGDE